MLESCTFSSSSHTFCCAGELHVFKFKPHSVLRWRVARFQVQATHCVALESCTFSSSSHTLCCAGDVHVFKFKPHILLRWRLARMRERMQVFVILRLVNCLVTGGSVNSVTLQRHCRKLIIRCTSQLHVNICKYWNKNMKTNLQINTDW